MWEIPRTPTERRRITVWGQLDRQPGGQRPQWYDHESISPEYPGRGLPAADAAGRPCRGGSGARAIRGSADDGARLCRRPLADLLLLARLDRDGAFPVCRPSGRSRAGGAEAEVGRRQRTPERRDGADGAERRADLSARRQGRRARPPLYLQGRRTQPRGSEGGERPAVPAATLRQD